MDIILYPYLKPHTQGEPDMNEHQSTADMVTITILQKELTVPTITPLYRDEIMNRISTLEGPPKKLSKVP